jgi:hypothetical protein
MFSTAVTNTDNKPYIYNETRDASLAAFLLRCVINADYYVVEMIVSSQPDLMFIASPGVDVNGEAIHMSPAQYAFYVHDDMMQKTFELHIKKIQMLQQYRAHVLELKKDFNFEPFKETYKSYLELLLKWKKDKASVETGVLDQAWREKVGVAQSQLLPRFMLRQMCATGGQRVWFDAVKYENLAERGLCQVDYYPDAYSCTKMMDILSLKVPTHILGKDVALVRGNFLENAMALKTSRGDNGYDNVSVDFKTFLRLIEMMKDHQDNHLVLLESECENVNRVRIGC